MELFVFDIQKEAVSIHQPLARVLAGESLYCTNQLLTACVCTFTAYVHALENKFHSKTISVDFCSGYFLLKTFLQIFSPLKILNLPTKLVSSQYLLYSLQCVCVRDLLCSVSGEGLLTGASAHNLSLPDLLQISSTVSRERNFVHYSSLLPTSSLSLLSLSFSSPFYHTSPNSLSSIWHPSHPLPFIPLPPSSNRTYSHPCS